MTEINSKSYPSVAQSWGIIGVAIVASFAFAPINVWLNGVVGKELSFLLYYILTMGAALGFAYFIRKKETGIVGFNIVPVNIKVVIIILFSTLALQIGIVNPIVTLIPIPDLFKSMFIEMAKLNGIFAFVAIAIAAPIFEESIFRGIILNGLLKKHSPFKSILISSLLFGIVHLNPWQFITAMIIGFFMGWIYFKTKNLALTIFIHFVNNSFAFISARFSDVETMFDQSLMDSFGGLLNAILIIVGSILILMLGVYFLAKEFGKEKEIQAVANDV